VLLFRKYLLDQNFRMNFLRTIRNNWKKTVVGTGLLIYTTHYLYERNISQRLHQAYCFEALKYSKEKVASTQKIRRVTVFLNPISNNERGKSLFETYVAPMLHLSGLDVRIVRLDSKNEAKQYMEVIDDKDTDCIVIAGGNRTITEALSGLLNRPDSDQIFSRIKLALLPVGESNALYENLLNLNLKKDTVKLLGDATLSIIKGETTSLDLIKVSYDENLKPLYALSTVSYGYLSDKKASLEDYWYYGPLKSHINDYYAHRLAYHTKKTFNIDYCNNCENCKSCFKEKYLKEEPKVNEKEEPRPKVTFLQSLIGFVFKGILSNKEKPENNRRKLLDLKYSQLEENPDCNIIHQDEIVEPTELIAHINRRQQIDKESSGIDLSISKLPSSLFHSNNLTSNETKLTVSELNLKKFKNGPNKLIIDGEVYDLSEKGESLEKVNIKYLNKSIKFLIDLKMNNDSILKKNDNPNIILSNYYANNSINYKKEHLDLNFIEPFRKYYNSFWNKN
jgi:hypothetical protein